MAGGRFLGFQGNGAAFDMGDGGPPWVVPRDWAQGLTGPVDPAMAAAVPAAPGAMGPTALASGPNASYEAGPPAPLASMAPPPQRPSMILDVDPGAPAPRAAAPLVPPGATLRIESGPGDTSAAKAAGWSQARIDAEVKKQDFAPAPAAAPQGAPAPGLSAGNPASGLVPTPGGAGGEAGGSRQPPSNMNAQEYQNWLRAEIAAEARRRPSAGTLMKGGKIQTAEGWQGEVGPNADTMARRRQLEDELAPLLGKRASADTTLATKQAENMAQQAEAEQRAAEAQAEIARRRTEELGSITEQGRQLQQKIASAEVDPNRWWASRGTGEKVALGAVMALGDIARGLIGRNRQGQNPILASVQQQIDKDVELQIRAIDKQRGDLNDVQKVYLQAKAKYEDEGIAADIAKQAGLQGLRAEMAKAAADYRGIQGQEAVYPPEDLKAIREVEESLKTAMDPNESPMARLAADAKYKALASKTRSFNVHERIAQLEMERLELDKRAVIEAKMNGVLSKNFGFTQDRVVGGSGGADPKKIRGLYKELNDVEGDQRKLSVSEREAAAKGKAGQADLRLPGGSMAVREGIPESLYNELAKKIVIADQYDAGLEEMVKRAKQPGGLTPGDPALKVFSDQAATLGSQLNWAGQPNTFQEELVIEASKPGPRQDAAIEALRGQSRALRSAVTKQLGR